MTPIAMGPVTDAHRRAAFERLAMRGWTYEAAMADDTRRRVIESCAAQLRKREIEAIDAFVDLHAFQLRQLSYAEFRRAYLTTEGQVRARWVQVVRESEVEHV